MAPKIIDRRKEALGGQSNDRPLSAVKKIVWHYTATLTSFITNHERFWRDTYGWDRGGYHYYIARDGTIYWNYNHTRMTWGVANNNWDTVHMSLEASTADNYTPEQIASRDWLTRKLMKELNVPASNVFGHYEVYNNTACPGYTRAEMDNFRRQLAIAPIVAGAKVHKVVSGDTLWGIATKYGMTVDKLKDLNDLDSNLIVVGQELAIDVKAPEPKPVYKKPALKPLDVIAQEVIDGKWGNGSARKKNLEAKGYNYHDVQAVVDRLFNKKNLLPLETVAQEVIAGKWGHGDARKKNLEAKGYNYTEVQNMVNKIVANNTPKKDFIVLPKTESRWRVYPLHKAPVVGNEVGFLTPAAFKRDLEYEVLKWEAKDVAHIRTESFGTVKIWVGHPARIIKK